MPQPPLLPAETLARVRRVARFDGLGALALGGAFALATAAFGEAPFATLGLLGAGAGAIELHGLALLDRRDPRGMRWLIASQPLLLVVLFGYCALRLWVVELPPIPETLREVFETGAQHWGLSVDDYRRAINRITLLIVALLGVGFQGGMILYYLRRREPVARALAEEP